MTTLSYQEIERFLQGNPLFKELPPHALAEIARKVTPQHFPPETHLVRRGEEGHSAFILYRGRVRVPLVDDQGHLRLVILLKEGDILGEMALITGEPRVADAIAEEETDALVIRREIFEEIFHRYPSVARFLTSLLAHRISEGQHHIGKYRVVKGHMRGGTSFIFQGIHPGLNRAVAIKMLSHALSMDSEFVRRLQKEAYIIAALKHPNIVEVYDTEWALGTFFIIMEFLEGTPLDILIDRQGRLSPAQCRSILLQLASALGYAHRCGIVHRDIKPANINIEPNGRVKLMDFGIACTAGQAQREMGCFGTPAYMSPDQILSDNIDGRSDIYTLGILCYKMLTGHVPFADEDPQKIIRAHIRRQVPPPATHFPDIPEDLNEFVLRATRKKPGERFQSMEEVLHFLGGRGEEISLSAPWRVANLTLLFDPTLETVVREIVQNLRQEVEKYPAIRLGIAEIDV
ncbi:MAG: hypothetical protein D6812_15160 [Deltaproteobacteria bacterium]|nr:MAG: hypothetical protein D6812_15160 [Deltaproteobacteria bacterium]